MSDEFETGYEYFRAIIIVYAFESSYWRHLVVIVEGSSDIEHS